MSLFAYNLTPLSLANLVTIGAKLSIISLSISKVSSELQTAGFEVLALSTILISLWLITIKHKILSNVIDFIAMENGIFLLSLSVAKEMPLLVNIGVLLDVFIAIYILGLFVSQINKEFCDMEVAHLSDLKDYEYND